MNDMEHLRQVAGVYSPLKSMPQVLFPSSSHTAVKGVLPHRWGRSRPPLCVPCCAYFV